MHYHSRMLDIDITTIFSFASDNPVESLIVGGMLFLLVGGLLPFAPIDAVLYFTMFGILFLFVWGLLWFLERRR